jgi:hypothetical protein
MQPQSRGGALIVVEEQVSKKPRYSPRFVLIKGISLLLRSFPFGSLFARIPLPISPEARLGVAMEVLVALVDHMFGRVASKNFPSLSLPLLS